MKVTGVHKYSFTVSLVYSFPVFFFFLVPLALGCILDLSSTCLVALHPQIVAPTLNIRLFSIFVTSFLMILSFCDIVPIVCMHIKLNQYTFLTLYILSMQQNEQKNQITSHFLFQTTHSKLACSSNRYFISACSVCDLMLRSYRQ